MQRIAKNLNFGSTQHRKNLSLKIGIHRGKVIAGVIGFPKP